MDWKFFSTVHQIYLFLQQNSRILLQPLYFYSFSIFTLLDHEDLFSYLLSVYIYFTRPREHSDSFLFTLVYHYLCLFYYINYSINFLYSSQNFVRNTTFLTKLELDLKTLLLLATFLSVSELDQNPTRLQAINNRK